MTRFLITTALALATLTGCFSTTVGLPCETAMECQAGQACITAPGGFCSRGCTEAGQTRDCPNDTICTNFGDGQLVCSTPCERDADCRPNFECLLTINGGSTSTCRPVKN